MTAEDPPRPALAEAPGLLITRPEPGASELAARMAALGWAPLVSPLMRLEPVAASPKAEGIAALVFTSANGARCAPDGAALRALPVWAVGESTARAAAAAGFGKARVGASDAAALAAQMLAADLRAGDRVLHLRGRHGTDGFAEALAEGGVQVEAVEVYAMQPTGGLNETARRALEERRVTVAAAYSPRSARLLVEAVRGFDLAGVAAVAISDAAAAPLASAGFAEVRIATSPDGAAMDAALGRPAPWSSADGLPRGCSGARSAPKLDRAGDERDDAMSEESKPQEDGGGRASTSRGTTSGPAPEADRSGGSRTSDGRTASSSRGLKVAAAVVVGVLAVLALSPAIAPYLPAPVARLLAPGDAASAEDVKQLRAELEEARTGLAEVQAEAGAVEAATAPIAEAVAALEARAESFAPDELEARAERTETALSDLAAQVEALGETAAVLPPEAAERVSAIAAALDAVTEETAALGARMERMEARLTSMDERFARIEAEAQSELDAAQAAAAAAVRAAELDEAFAKLAAEMATGNPFDAALEAMSEFGPPPAALAEAAATGVPTAGELRDGLTDASFDALAALRRAEAGGGLLGRLFAGVGATLAGVPVDERAGDGAEGMIGAASARMRDGDATGALAMLDGLPEAASTAFDAWRAQARRTAAAQEAAEAWRSALAEAG